MSNQKNRTLDISALIGTDVVGIQLGTAISRQYMTWETLRTPWLDEKRELRNYVFATSTKTTSNASLPWKNTTTIPKLCQIRDNLHANYIAALFPNSEWLDWEGDDKDSVAAKKAKAIKGYVRNKIKASKFETTVESLLLDWVDYGQCFATVEAVNESRENLKDGTKIAGYAGPKLVRISPYDICFNPTANGFENTPKIIRTLKSIGELKKDVLNNPNDKEASEAFNHAIRIRKENQQYNVTDLAKDDAYRMDGFGSYQQYLNSGTVEILTFYGDIYDVEKDELLENHIISVIDRAFILTKRKNPSWLGKDMFFTHGWRKRPDNIYSMGPLDNLVGMQYRIDHLENLKADAFDMIAFPMMVIKGEVEAFAYQPGEKIYTGDGGDVGFLHPDVTALNADMQIRLLEEKMEEMAGAPKQAMGIRTPGEKTAFEVQTLENAAGRIFQNKILSFEKEFLTPVLNGMLEVGRREMSSPEIIKNFSSDIDAVTFNTVTQDDLLATGKIYPVGASHFAKRANYVQNLASLMQTIGADPDVKVHLSGKALAKAVEEMLDLDKFSIFAENIRVLENLETQKLVQVAQEDLAVHGQTDGIDAVKNPMEGT